MMMVIFPSCKFQNTVALTAKYGQKAAVCQKCKREFTCDLVRIRAKRSRRTADILPSRAFDVRVFGGDGSERLIQFEGIETGDFELRSNGSAIFVSQNQRICIVQNLTIGTWYEVKYRNPLVAFILIAIIAIVIVFALSSR
jgi:hypothetical protein